MRSERLAWFARGTAGAAFFLLFAGGLVTSTDSGLAVPDWPLSYGRFFPPMVGGVLFEHGHRMVAGAVGLLTLVLAACVFRSETPRHVRTTAALAAAGIALQALLGGLTVLLLLPPAVSVSHAVLGQTVFCLLLALAHFLGSREGRERPGSAALGRSSPGPWRACASAALGVYVQLILGAVLRHTGRGLSLHLAGALAAWALAYRAAWIVLRSETPESLAGPARAVLALVPLQAALGAAALAIVTLQEPGIRLWRAGLPTLHQALGAALLGTTVVWTLRARALDPRVSPAAGTAA